MNKSLIDVEPTESEQNELFKDWYDSYEPPYMEVNYENERYDARAVQEIE
jgi:hypothetical protein